MSNTEEANIDIATLQEWQKAINSKLQILIDSDRRMFEPDGIYSRQQVASSERIARLELVVMSLSRQQKIQWVLMLLLISALIKLAFFGS